MSKRIAKELVVHPYPSGHYICVHWDTGEVDAVIGPYTKKDEAYASLETMSIVDGMVKHNWARFS